MPPKARTSAGPRMPRREADTATSRAAGHRRPRPWSATSLAAMAIGVVVALSMTSAGAMRIGGGAVTTSPVTVAFVAAGECSTSAWGVCSIPLARNASPGTYLLLVFLHGPGGKPGSPSDSAGSTFTELSNCWLDNGVFGHTAVFLSRVAIASPGSFRVNLTPLPADAGGDGEYMEAALLSDPNSSYTVGPVANTCVNERTTPSDRVLWETFEADQPGDLGLFLFVAGQAASNSSPIECMGLTATLADRCGTNLSGGPLGSGLSWPILAYAGYTSAGLETGTVSISGGGCGAAPCYWSPAVVAVHDP